MLIANTPIELMKAGHIPIKRNEIATRKRLETRIRRKNTKEEIIFNLNTSSGMSGKALQRRKRTDLSIASF